MRVDRASELFEQNIRAAQASVESCGHALADHSYPAWSAAWAALEELDRFARCLDGCPRDDHALRYIAARGGRLAAGALSATMSGWYDLALAGARSLVDYSMVLAVIGADKNANRVFQAGTAEERNQLFNERTIEHRIVSLDLLDLDETELRERCFGPRMHPLGQRFDGEVEFGFELTPTRQHSTFRLAVNELAQALVIFMMRLVERLHRGGSGTETEQLALAGNALAQAIECTHFEGTFPDLRTGHQIDGVDSV